MFVRTALRNSTDSSMVKTTRTVARVIGRGGTSGRRDARVRASSCFCFDMLCVCREVRA